MNLFIDSGILIHLFDEKDRTKTNYNHKIIKDVFNSFLHKQELFSSNFVIAETMNHVIQLVNDKLYNSEHLKSFWEEYISILNIVSLEYKYIERAWELINSYEYKFNKYSFVDALSLTFIQEEFNNFDKDYLILTTDSEWYKFWWYKGYDIKMPTIYEI